MVKEIKKRIRFSINVKNVAFIIKKENGQKDVKNGVKIQKLQFGNHKTFD